MGKGPDYERTFCKQLSLWWTHGRRDDVFWRAQNSGGRATARARQGRATAGQYGDVAYTDPVGKPLIDLITWELKRGYTTQGIQDLLDFEDSNATRELEKFFWQAIEAHEKAGSLGWVLVLRRNHRRDFMWMAEILRRRLGPIPNSTPGMYAKLLLRKKKKKEVTHTRRVLVVGMPVEHFLHHVSPGKVKRALEYWHDERT